MSHRPAFSSYEKGTWGFRLRASFFLSDEKETKESPGAAHGHFQCPIPPPPAPPFLLRGSHQGALYLHPARAKDRIPLLAPPAAQPLAALPPYGCGVPLAGAAAPCWSNGFVLLQEQSRLAFSPRRAVSYGEKPPASSFPGITWSPPAWATGSPPGRPPGPGKPGRPAGQRALHPGSAPPAAGG